jgi:hypothetical protein
MKRPTVTVRFIRTFLTLDPQGDTSERQIGCAT